MKKLFKVSIIMLIVLLTGCSKNLEQYDSKDISVASAFDGLEVKAKEGDVESVFDGFDYKNSDPKNLKTAFDSEDNIDVSEKEEIKFPIIMVSSDLLRLRMKADVKSQTIKLLQPGEEVEVLEKGLGDNWRFSKVKSGDNIGYVATELLLEPGTAEPPLENKADLEKDTKINDPVVVEKEDKQATENSNTIPKEKNQNQNTTSEKIKQKKNSQETSEDNRSENNNTPIPVSDPAPVTDPKPEVEVLDPLPSVKPAVIFDPDSYLSSEKEDNSKPESKPMPKPESEPVKPKPEPVVKPKPDPIIEDESESEEEPRPRKQTEPVKIPEKENEDKKETNTDPVT